MEDLPDEVLQDPEWTRSGRARRGRDGCQVPIPWRPGGPPYGFSPPGATAPPWLPQPLSWGTLTAEVQKGDPGSMLELYREALRVRHSEPALGDGTMRWLDAPAEVLAFYRGPSFACVLNMSSADVPLPTHDSVLLASSPLVDGLLPPDSAVWLRIP